MRIPWAAQQLFSEQGLTMAQVAKSTRIEIVEPLRGIASLAVAWYHFTDASFVRTGWLRASGEYGWLGVEVFFVISGFVIPYSLHCGRYRPTQHFGRFLFKRVTRLEPPYIFSILLVIVLWHLSAISPGFTGSQPNYSAAQVLLHLGYLNTFFGYPWLNGVYWTLGIEFQYYLFVALLYPLLVARRSLVRGAMLLAMVGAPLLVLTPKLVFHYLGLFTLGVLAFQYHAAFLSNASFVLSVLITVAIGITISNQTEHAWLTGLVGGSTSLIIAFVPMPRHSTMRVFVFLGGISYSLYLLHSPVGSRVINLGARFGEGLMWELLVLVVAVGVSITASVGFHRLVERPSQRFASRVKYT